MSEELHTRLLDDAVKELGRMREAFAAMGARFESFVNAAEKAEAQRDKEIEELKREQKALRVELSTQTKTLVRMKWWAGLAAILLGLTWQALLPALSNRVDKTINGEQKP